MNELTSTEIRLVRYALKYLNATLDDCLAVEAAQEAAPETQTTGEPLPNVPDLIEAILAKLSRSRQPS